MAYIYFNPNPENSSEPDCVVRAICKITNKDWDSVYWGICTQGGIMRSMPSVNKVWGEYLYRFGFNRYTIPNTCPNCYTIRDFCIDNPYGKFVLGTGSHVVAVIDGNYYDAWDSGSEVPIYFWTKEKIYD